MANKSILTGLVAIAFVVSSSGIGHSFAEPNGTPFLKEELEAIEQLVKDLQAELDLIEVTWDRVTEKPDELVIVSTICTIDQIAKWDGSQWVCTDNNTLFFMSCTIDQIAKWDGSQWVCTDSASDSLAGDFALRKVDCNIIREKLDLPTQFDTVNGCNLVGAGLDDIEIPNANLSLADLTEAVFDEAYLPNVDFSGANLSGVDFYKTDISGAILTGTFADPPCFNHSICATLPTS